MSGGSFSYLCHNTDVQGLCKREAELEEMYKELEFIANGRGSVDAAKVAIATREVIVHLRKASLIAHRLAPAWRAVEWHTSRDWGENQMLEALAQVAANPDIMKDHT